MDVRNQKTVRCRACGYFLHGLRSQYCPECGAPFDPNRGDTVLGLGPGTVSGRLVLLAILLVLAAAVGFLCVIVT